MHVAADTVLGLCCCASSPMQKQIFPVHPPPRRFSPNGRRSGDLRHRTTPGAEPTRSQTSWACERHTTLIPCASPSPSAAVAARNKREAADSTVTEVAPLSEARYCSLPIKAINRRGNAYRWGKATNLERRPSATLPPQSHGSAAAPKAAASRRRFDRVPARTWWA